MMQTDHLDNAQGGFTLIELSFVLVIIGMILGGVLIGQELIEAAKIRSAIAQIESFNTAINLFRNKYDTLPGDVPPAKAAAWGLQSRSGAAGHGDGNSLIESCGWNRATTAAGCESILFWMDLSTADLIDGAYNLASDAFLANLPSAQLPLYFPASKIGGGNYITVASENSSFFWPPKGSTWFIIAGLDGTANAIGDYMAHPAMTPVQLYAIDQKVDDSMPYTGKVRAIVPSPSLYNQFGNCTDNSVPQKYNLQGTVFNVGWPLGCGAWISIAAWPQ
jgi:prepilin-type N-terminal cleavage/methylation domain-containing protein